MICQFLLSKCEQKTVSVFIVWAVEYFLWRFGILKTLRGYLLFNNGISPTLMKNSNANRICFSILEYILCHCISSCSVLSDKMQLLHVGLHSNKMCLWEVMNAFVHSSDLFFFSFFLNLNYKICFEDGE